MSSVVENRLGLSYRVDRYRCILQSDGERSLIVLLERTFVSIRTFGE